MWYVTSIINFKIIVRSVKVTGYNNNFYLSKDNLFNVFRILKEEGIIERDKEVNNEKIKIEKFESIDLYYIN